MLTGAGALLVSDNTAALQKPNLEFGEPIPQDVAWSPMTNTAKGAKHMSFENHPSADINALRALFDGQKRAYARDPYPQTKERLDRLDRLDGLIARHKEEIIAALNTDFGCRARTETILAEILGCHGAIHYARKNLRRWMRPRKRRPSFWSRPAKAYVMAQPLGVVGVMAPWNYALHLSIAPMVAAIAAGNRVMLAMSEETPTLCTLMQTLFSKTFDADLITVVQGGGELSPAFARLPFDHLLFTGSTRVGRLIAQAAASNLTPVTLELGGKSPAIVGPDYALSEAASRIGWGKTFNAGQTCVAPDYVYVPKSGKAAFAKAVLAKFSSSFSGVDDPDFTAIISERFYRRLEDLVAEAQAKGATILRPDGFAPSRKGGVFKYPPTLVLDVPKECRLLQEEIFGPVLPVLTYEDMDEVVAQISAGDRPLALYCFTHDRDLVQRLQRETVSGSFGLNETLLQYAQEDLAFGGVGASGQGAYHGQAGFDTFSHLKSVFEQRGFGSFTGIKLLHPPYGRVARFVLKAMQG